MIVKRMRWDRNLVHKLQQCDQYIKGAAPDRSMLQTVVVNRAIPWAIKNHPFYNRAPAVRRVGGPLQANLHGTMLEISITRENWVDLTERVYALGRIRESHLTEHMTDAYLQEVKFHGGFPDEESCPVVHLEREL